MGHVKGLFGDSLIQHPRGAGASGCERRGLPRLLYSAARRRSVPTEPTTEESK